MGKSITFQRAFLFLVLPLAGLLIVLGGISFQRKVESFQPLGFEGELVAGSSWRVRAVSDPRIGFEVGDIIATVRGQVAANGGHLADLLTEQPMSEVFVMRGPEMVSTTYQRPAPKIEVPYLILTAIGIGYLLIGLYTAFKDSRAQAQLFFLWCWTSAALYVLSPPSFPADRLDQAVFLLDQLARILLPALTVHLFLIFPWKILDSRRLQQALPFVYLPAAALIGVHADQMFSRQPLFGRFGTQKIAWLDQLELFLIILGALAACAVVVARFSQRPGWEQRRQTQWILFGLLGGYLPFLALYATPRALDLDWPNWVTSLAVLPLSLVPLAFAWAILKYKLLDLGLILRDTLAIGLTGLVGLFGFALVNLAVRSGITAELSLARNLLTFAAGIAIAGVMSPTRSAIAAGLDRFRFRGHPAQRQILGDLGRQLLYERDLDKLCELLIDQLDDTLLTRTNLYLVQGDHMIPARPDDKIPARLSLEALGEDVWGREVVGISAVTLPRDQPSEAQALFAAGFRYAFPLTVRGHRIGFALLAYKLDQEPLDSEDLDLVRSVLNQASLSIENAQLLSEVVHRLREVSRLEEHNKDILESSPAGIAVLDEDDRVISSNQAFEMLVAKSGTRSGQEATNLIGQQLEDLLPIHPLPEPQDGLIEVSYCDLSGAEHYFQLSVAGHRGLDSHKVLVIQDQSGRVALELELKEKERLASLGMLAAGVAHEVNTPLTGISSYAQMLLSDTANDDPSYPILKKMERQTFRAAQIVNNLLEFARNRRDQPITVSLRSILAESLSLLEDRAASAGVELVWETPGEALEVRGNEGELHQVFTNLMVNSLDAMSAMGTGRVEVRCQQTERHVTVAISDTGPGIPPERLETIFHPFFSTKLGKGGTGLGLAITYNIVRRHGGELQVKNHEGKPGCTFSVRLPRSAAE